jgi:hypothetical protein
MAQNSIQKTGTLRKILCTYLESAQGLSELILTVQFLFRVNRPYRSVLLLLLLFVLYFVLTVIGHRLLSSARK